MMVFHNVETFFWSFLSSRHDIQKLVWGKLLEDTNSLIRIYFLETMMMIMAVTQINQRQLGGPFRVHFRGHWHISGADFFLPWPPLSTQSDFYGPKWVVQVSHIEYCICSTRTYWGHFRPSLVRFCSLAKRSSLLLRQCKFCKYCF